MARNEQLGGVPVADRDEVTIGTEMSRFAHAGAWGGSIPPVGLVPDGEYNR
jgi:hypothetical protein